MQVKFYRNTHDSQGRVLEHVGQACESINAKLHGLGVHVLEPFQFQAKTFDQFVAEHHKYAQDFPECPAPSVEELLGDLRDLLIAGLAVSVIEKEE